VIIWDLVAEKGKLRLSGHKGVVTQVCFMNELPVVISSSKDTLVKFWDLDTGHCFKTLVGHKAEVSSPLPSNINTIINPLLPEFSKVNFFTNCHIGNF
jgi:WD40 repeat protein